MPGFGVLRPAHSGARRGQYACLEASSPDISSPRAPARGPKSHAGVPFAKGKKAQATHRARRLNPRIAGRDAADALTIMGCCNIQLFAAPRISSHLHDDRQRRAAVVLGCA